MNDRRPGFLWEDERELIDAHRPRIVSSGEEEETDLSERRFINAKSRMKTDIASPEGLEEVLQNVRDDLERIEDYYCRVRDQPGGRWEWDDRVLPRIKREVEANARLFERWSQTADREGDQQVQKVLVDATQPLHDGLDHLNRDLQGEFPAEGGSDDELAADREELKERRRALQALLEDAELRVIFQYISTHQEEGLPDRKKKGQNWKWWSTRYLKTKHGLVEDGAWGPKLTPRGERVDEVLWNLEEKDLQARLGIGSVTTAEAALTAMHHHLPTEHWSGWHEGE